MAGPAVNFSDGVASYGVPLLGGGSFTIPPMGGRIAGTSGDARYFFVDPANGSNSNDGLSPATALDTVSAAYAKTVDKRGDVIYLLNDGNTSGTSREDATITWSNDNTHLIGWCAPSMISQRARISPSSGNTEIVTPQLTVSGSGCMFANFALFEGTDENSVASECVRVTGHRNVFSNVSMMNLGEVSNAHAGDEANSCHLKISGGEENLFLNCYIGLDTAPRSTTNANVELVSAAARNIFVDCIFPAFADSATALFVKADGSGDIDRFNIFRNCLFINADNSSATTMTAAINAHASAGGHIVIDDCGLIGCTDWTATDSSVVRLLGAAPAALTTGIAVSVDVS